MIRKIQSKMQDRKGFTLIELMIVIAILGVLAAIAIPYYNQYILNSKLRVTRTNYEQAVRTVKNEFANKIAGNVAATSLVAMLNDFGKNKNPFNPVEDAFVVAGALGTGQVEVDPDTVSSVGLGDAVTITADFNGTQEVTILTYE